MKRRALVVALLAFVCVAGAPAGTGPDKALVKQVKDLSDSAVKEFEAGNAAKSIDLFQQAITLVQKSLTGSLTGYLPKAPEGWTGGKIEQESFAATGPGLGQWNQVKQTFTKTADKDLTVRVEITNSPLLVQVQQGMWTAYQNPQMLAMMNQDPKHQIALVDRDGWKGFTTIDKDKSAQATLFTGGGLISVNVSKDKMDVLNQFIGLIDLKAAAKSLAASTPAPKTTDE